ncbi:MAG TPA: OmpA family protein [Chryseolinea sp.]|nr:OmpA family protein [Chryseolinea sp.]
MTPALFRSLLFCILVSLAAITHAQQFYVIVGAFAQESNAQKFTGYVRSLRYAAEYELHKEKNFFYVYVLKTESRADAVSQVKQLQQDSEFKDTWLFNGHLGTSPLPPKVEIVEAVPPVAEPEKTELPVTDTATTITEAPIIPPPITTTPTVETVVKARGKLFRFQLQTVDGRPVHGEVHNVDYKRGRDIAVYKSDEYIDVLPPSRDNNPMSIVCGIFGYKEVVRVVNYDSPDAEDGVIKDEKGAWVIPYQLERLKKGDVSVMYHVAFYKDAVVMLPQSKPEMDELVTMMKDNPAYKIKIHGHCNGNNTRKIIALGAEKNYFNIQGSDERNGSAKDLSKLRAEAVQSYLIDNGVSKDRSAIYAWGGQNMLVPETSTSAKLNDRIEIEIQAD